MFLVFFISARLGKKIKTVPTKLCTIPCILEISSYECFISERKNFNISIISSFPLKCSDNVLPLLAMIES